MFGGLSVSAGGAELPAEIAHIARDPLDPEFDDDAFVRRASAAARPASSGCCSTRPLISGVGNIYADEALWRARLHGDRPGDRLRRAEVARVLADARAVMGAALGEGGTSFDALYVNVNGESGYFDRSLHAYGRRAGPATRCGTPIRAGRVHEPLVVLLPALPAPPPTAPTGHPAAVRAATTASR